MAEWCLEITGSLDEIPGGTKMPCCQCGRTVWLTPAQVEHMDTSHFDFNPPSYQVWCQECPDACGNAEIEVNPNFAPHIPPGKYGVVYLDTALRAKVFDSAADATKWAASKFGSDSGWSILYRKPDGRMYWATAIGDRSC
jgi:hypothetical protein